MNYNKVEDVFIRTVKYLTTKDESLVGMFLNASDKMVPVYYEYAQKAKATEAISDNDKIGHATNFHIVDGEDGGYVACDVYINPLHPATHNFTNTLDNYGVSFKDGEYNLIRFTIYNKAFKEKVDAELLEKAKNTETFN